MTSLLTEGSLRSHAFLEGCNAEFLNHLEEFATDVDFAAGDTILKEGEYADRFYLICAGRVSLETRSDGGPAITIAALGPADLLGWSWLYPPFEWHFTATALEPIRAVELNAASLLIRAEEDPAFGYELMKRIAKHMVHRLQALRSELVREASRHSHS